MLPQFDLASAIAAYNQQRHAHYRLDEHFGCPCLEPKMLALAQQAITAIKRPYLLHWWTREELSFLKQRHARLRSWQAAWQGGETTLPWPYTEEKDQAIAQSLRQKFFYYGWANSTYKILSGPEQWARWRQQASAKNALRLKALQSRWQQHHHFMCANPATVLDLAETLLPSLIAHHRRGLRLPWRQRRRLPKPIYAAYQRHCQAFLAAAKALQQQLVEAMLLRLEALSESGLAHSDPLLSFCQQLQQCGAAMPLSPSGAINHATLTATEFSAFHAYIVKHGDGSTKQRLRQLAWLRPNRALALQTVQTGNGCCLAPKDFSQDVPQKTIWFPGWFRGAYLRQQFFQDKGLLLAQLGQLPIIEGRPSGLPGPDQIGPHWQICEEKLGLVATELTELQAPAYQNFPWPWQRRTKRFFQRWENMLINYRQQLLLGQLEIAENLAKTLIKQATAQHAVFPWQAIDLLKAMLSTLGAQLAARPDELLLPRLQAAKAQANALLSTQRALALLARLGQGHALGASELQYLLDYSSATALYDQKVFATFKKQGLPLLQQALAQCKAKLGLGARPTAQPLAQQGAYLLSAAVALRQLGSQEQQQALENMLQKKLPQHFFFYLQAIAAKNTPPNELAHMAEALICLGQSAPIAGQSISHHAATLEQHNAEKAGERARALATALLAKTTETLLQRRLEKDARAFDEQLWQALGAHPHLRYSGAALAAVKSIRDQMLKEGVADVNDLSTPLPSYERALIGLEGNSSQAIAAVASLLGLNVRAHQLAAKAAKHQSAQCQKKLAECFYAQFKQNTATPSFALFWPSLGKSRSGKRDLFACPAWLKDETSATSACSAT